jgi:P27 family predicted phage terminase small subunit
MTQRGAKPKPTRLKALSGTLRNDRTNALEPDVTAAIPTCPRDLSAVAKREWKRIAPVLADMGLLSTIDRAALAGYCQAWATWIEAQKSLQKHGVIIKSPNGYFMPSPFMAVANKAFEQMRLMLAEFGMSPSSRARVHAVPREPELDEFELWQRSGRAQ